MLEVYTSTIRYRGPDRLDISIKSGSKVFAPTWNMVMEVKSQVDCVKAQEEYTKTYLKMMKESFCNHPKEWDSLFERERVVLCCYCRPGEVCHRTILARFLVKLGAKYMGEIEASPQLRLIGI